MRLHGLANIVGNRDRTALFQVEQYYDTFECRGDIAATEIDHLVGNRHRLAAHFQELCPNLQQVAGIGQWFLGRRALLLYLLAAMPLALLALAVADATLITAPELVETVRTWLMTGPTMGSSRAGGATTAALRRCSMTARMWSASSSYWG